MKCEQCHGHGAPAFFDVVECPACMDSFAEGPCVAHACRQCLGSGHVCPSCRGMRSVRSPVWNSSTAPHQNVRAIERCAVCCEGNNVNTKREDEAIKRYLFRWHDAVQAAAARGESYVEPRSAKQHAVDAEMREQQADFAESMQGKVRERVRRNIRHAQEQEQVSRPVTRDKRTSDNGGAMLGQLLHGIQSPDTPRERLRQQTIQRATREDGTS